MRGLAAVLAAALLCIPVAARAQSYAEIPLPEKTFRAGTFSTFNFRTQETDPQNLPPIAPVVPASTPNPATMPPQPADKAAISPPDKPAQPVVPTGWTLVSVPMPPALDKKLRTAALKEEAAKAQELKAQELKAQENGTQEPAALPPEATPGTAPAAGARPTATAKPATISTLFTQPGNAAAPSNDDSSRLVMPGDPSAFARVQGASTRTASLTFFGDKKSRRKLRRDGTEDDDMEDDGETQSSYIPGVEKQVASVQTDCLKPDLMAMIKQTGDHFGKPAVITSGFRSHGRRGSLHRRCEAADFQIEGVSSAQIIAYLRKLPGAGGIGTYCRTKSVHLDLGQPREWHQCMSYRRFALRTTAAQ